MKKYKSLIIISVVLTTLAACFYLLSVNLNDFNLIEKNLQTITNLITIGSSIVLMAIGLVFFNKYGGDQKVVDEQMVKVMSLINYISKIKFMIKVVEEGNSRGTIMNLTIFSYDENIEVIKNTEILNGKNFSKFVQFMNSDFMNIFNEIVAFGNEQYLPKKLKSQIDILENNMPKFSAAFNEDEVPTNYLMAVLKTTNRINIIDKTESLITTYGLSVDHSIAPLQYDNVIKDIRNIYDAANKWMKTNNSSVYDSLNIQTLSKNRNK